MSLENKTLSELEELRAQLRRTIERNPNHSKIEKIELEDVEGWIKLRVKELRSGPQF